jgi:alpha-tubulin suppressor-like RCC1 family protein
VEPKGVRNSVTPSSQRKPVGETRQRSNSWRDKIIRGSLDCDDDDIIIGGNDNSEDESEAESQNDQVFGWGVVVDKYMARPSPIRLGMSGQDDFSVRSMACGDSHILFLTEAGHVWAMGKNSEGQLGLGDSMKARATPKLVMFLTDQAISFVAAAGDHSACLDDIGRLHEWGRGEFYFIHHYYYIIIFLLFFKKCTNRVSQCSSRR